MSQTVNIFWFRRDLRLEDNCGLSQALSSKPPVLPIFIFDTEILEKLPKDDARVTFINNTIIKLNQKLKKHGSGIATYHGKPENIFLKLVGDYTIKAVYTNHDYEPYAKERDYTIHTLLKSHNIHFHTFKDQVIFEKNEIVKNNGDPYVVYTPYMKTWKSNLKAKSIELYNIESHFNNYLKSNTLPQLSLTDIGFKKSTQTIEDYDVSHQLIQEYEEKRNFPSKKATSRLGPHLRFGTVSIREIVNKALIEKNEVFLQELIWREFFMQILWHYPTTIHKSFRPKYDRIAWRNNEDEFKAWCEGNTGYPMVDAGMRQLNITGFMHNRVRMVTASFLCKHLLIDWRWGEAYFAEKLHDYEQASNVGNWQWCAGSGVDAAPYFRIFNPTTQIKKFDKDYTYIKKWIPQLNELTYPSPIVDHKEARERCFKVYKAALN